MIYFDNGATTFPKPARVEQAVLEAMRKYGANPGRSGHKLSLDTALKVYECREAAAMLFNVGAAENVVFTSNCTHAINLALKGVLERGDHVIISDLEHNSVLRPVHTLANMGFITYSVAEICENDDETIASFAGHIRANTRLIACTHGSNVLGVRVPMERIGLLCQEHGILFLLDAAQTAGVLPIDMEKNRIDFLCTAGHKGLYGPSGTGILATPVGNALRTLIEGGTGTMSADYTQPFDMPERLESGTVNTMGIMGLRAGIDYVQDKGIDTIYNHEMKLCKMIYNRLSNMDRITLYTKSFETGSHLPVIPFNVMGLTSEEATEKLSDLGFALRGGLHCAPLAHKKLDTMSTGAVRISTGAFNNMAQSHQLCDAIERVAAGKE